MREKNDFRDIHKPKTEFVLLYLVLKRYLLYTFLKQSEIKNKASVLNQLYGGQYNYIVLHCRDLILGQQ